MGLVAGVVAEAHVLFLVSVSKELWWRYLDGRDQAHTARDPEAIMVSHSPHALHRAQNRSVSDAHIEFALLWGTPIVQPMHRVAYHVGVSDIRQARKAGAEIPHRVEGVAVVTSIDRTVVTVIRTSDRRKLALVGRWRESLRHLVRLRENHAGG